MLIEADQSGRIENLTQDSVLAFANKASSSVFFHRREKRKCLIVLRRRYRVVKNWPLKIFSACLFLLIKDFLDEIDILIIDIEFSGREGDIKGMLLRHIRKIRPDFSKDRIQFQNIGKKSKAHIIAYKIYKREAGADRIIKAEDVLSLL